MVKKYMKKPIGVEVIQYTDIESGREIEAWSNNKCMLDEYNNSILINTLEGVMTAVPGSYIIKGNEGEFWAVKQSIFEKTYMLVTSEHGVSYNGN
jgi:hypothetical protein